MPHNSATAPYAFDGGRTGVLLCHGFTGSPASMRPWGEYLARHGYSVRIPLLPGHGTDILDMNRRHWTEWYEEDLRGFLELRERCERVFVFGLSMGGTLTLRLAQELGDAISGIALVNAFVRSHDRRAPLARMLQHVITSLPATGNDIKKPGVVEHSYDRTPVRAFVQLQDMAGIVRRDIARVHQPTLMFVSAEDHVVDPANGSWIAEHVSSKDLSSIVLEDSYHVATLDNDAERIFQASLGFIERLGG